LFVAHLALGVEFVRRQAFAVKVLARLEQSGKHRLEVVDCAAQFWILQEAAPHFDGSRVPQGESDGFKGRLNVHTGANRLRSVSRQVVKRHGLLCEHLGGSAIVIAISGRHGDVARGHLRVAFRSPDAAAKLGRKDFGLGNIGHHNAAQDELLGLKGQG
jgi:hypothetical protein